MSLFFIALALPTGTLIWQAYSQLKWEAFYQHRLMAEELVSRIDRQLTKLIEIENQRPYTDYTFLNITGSKEANFLQRSPLASFPPRSSIPGAIGYFQVDASGSFSGPLLPDPVPVIAPTLQRYGLARADIIQRKQINDQLYRLLRDNNLLAAPIANNQSSEPVYKPEQESAVSDRSQESSVSYSPAAAPTGLSETRSANKGTINQPADELMAEEVLEIAESQLADHLLELDESGSGEDLDITRDVYLEPNLVVMKAVKAPSPQKSGFDDLQMRSDSAASVSRSTVAPGKTSAISAPTTLGRIEDLKLEQQYGKQLAAAAATKKKRDLAEKKTVAALFKSADKKRSQRKEQNQLPIALAAQPLLLDAISPTDETDLSSAENYQARVRLFETNIDGLELGQLGSGHLVLYRNVWQNGQRTIQGLIVDSAQFIQSTISDGFLQTSLAQAGNLTIALQGNVLSLVSGQPGRSYLSRAQQLQGELLLQQKLSAPLGNLELVFSVNNLPSGPGAKVLNWTSLVLLMVMAVGSWLIYRLALSQLKLAQQQQNFVSAVSHELKTPLTSIRMYGEILQQGWASEEKKRTYYDYIYAESDRLSRLINNVLQLASLSRNQSPIALSPHRVTELMDTLRSKISTQIEHAGFELNIDTTPEVLNQSLMIELDSFCQIIINLVDNAIKFSRNAAQQKIDIGCQISADKLQFTIRDYGPGIDANQMKRIFQLFYRSENELSRETAGTGIGLALVHQLVIAMNGEVDVVNIEPGAEFRVRFKRMKILVQ